MKYISTRNSNDRVSGCEAIVRGLSKDGGLYVPETIPVMSESELYSLAEMPYSKRAAFIIAKFLPELDGIEEMTGKAYAKFDDGDAAPVVKLDDGMYMLELWHGPTHAFKDIALTLLPYLMTGSKKVIGSKERTLILVATSGDTGKAALEGFKDVEGTDIIVFYPEDGVSKLQKLQMMTQKGGNVFVSAVKGNFDDAQTAVKKAFSDPAVVSELASRGYALSSANSINWGRLVPQICYYFSAYIDLIEGGQIRKGEKINFCVPSGNFGNILAGYYAMKMGLPVGKLVCASNKNNVLTDFIGGGEYNVNREFFKTSSPSMDILISSNLERLVFELSGRNDKLTAERMNDLKLKGNYHITPDELKTMSEIFAADCSDEEEVFEVINSVFEEYGYILDTHTAVAVSVYDKCESEELDDYATVIVGTASPYKFVGDVLKALEEKVPADEMKALLKLESVTALPLPESLSELTKLEKRFTGTVEIDKVSDVVKSYKK